MRIAIDANAAQSASEQQGADGGTEKQGSFHTYPSKLGTEASAQIVPGTSATQGRVLTPAMLLPPGPKQPFVWSPLEYVISPLVLSALCDVWYSHGYAAIVPRRALLNVRY
eukprot:1204197-Rhodomonas_salina.1